MSRSHNSLIRLLLACALLMAGLPAHAEVAIEVSARCEAAGMCGHYGQKIHGILDQLRFQILQDLQKRSRLSYWTFKAESAPNGRPASARQPGSPLKLELKVVSPQRNVLQLLMTYTAPTTSQSWEEVWMDPGQLKTDGYPRSEYAAAEIFRLALRKLLSPNEEALRSLLERSAPLALGGRWNGDPRTPRIVLPLQWDRFKALSQSQFRLDCTWSAKTKEPEIVLISEGTQDPGDYEDGNKKAYRALSVAPRTWREHRDPEERQRPFAKLSNGQKLYPRLAYLYKEKLGSGSLIEVFEGGGQ